MFSRVLCGGLCFWFFPSPAGVSSCWFLPLVVCSLSASLPGMVGLWGRVICRWGWGGFLVPSPAMREIWLGLVLEFGPATAALHPVVDRHPLAHVLPIEESESLLQAVDCGPVLLLCAWCTVLAGASLGLANIWWSTASAEGVNI